MTLIQTEHTAAAASRDLSNAETTTLFRQLRRLMAACGAKTNKHDLAIVLITACIEGGLDTRPRLIGALRQLGLDPRHAAIVLNNETGDDPRRHRWHRDIDGGYRLHPEQLSP